MGNWVTRFLISPFHQYSPVVSIWYQSVYMVCDMFSLDYGFPEVSTQGHRQVRQHLWQLRSVILNSGDLNFFLITITRTYLPFPLLSWREGSVLWAEGWIENLTGVVRGLRSPLLKFSKGMCSPLTKGVVQSHVRGVEHPKQGKRRVKCEFTFSLICRIDFRDYLYLFSEITYHARCISHILSFFFIFLFVV